eukprot:363366-Chlamydomonas_euryale.AAC.2
MHSLQPLHVSQYCALHCAESTEALWVPYSVVTMGDGCRAPQSPPGQMGAQLHSPPRGRWVPSSTVPGGADGCPAPRSQGQMGAHGLASFSPRGGDGCPAAATQSQAQMGARLANAASLCGGAPTPAESVGVTRNTYVLEQLSGETLMGAAHAQLLRPRSALRVGVLGGGTNLGLPAVRSCTPQLLLRDSPKRVHACICVLPNEL